MLSAGTGSKLHECHKARCAVLARYRLGKIITFLKNARLGFCDFGLGCHHVLIGRAMASEGFLAASSFICDEKEPGKTGLLNVRIPRGTTQLLAGKTPCRAMMNIKPRNGAMLLCGRLPPAMDKAKGFI